MFFRKGKMAMESSEKKRKVMLVIVAVIALVVTLFGGTFAYNDLKQHKSNELRGSTIKYEARLVEDFTEVTDWKAGDGPVGKKISVVNKGEAEQGYGDVYVRIQLKEYMEIGEIRYKETEKRYMLDSSGNFIIFETEADAIAATAAGSVYDGHACAELTDAVTGKHGWFIETQDHDVNGQMGKHVVTEFDVGEPVKVIKDGPDKATDTNHHGTVLKDGDGNVTGFSHESEECLYKIHSWKDDPGSRLDTRDYIEWQLNTGAIITVSEWLDPNGLYKGQPVAKWIVEDRDDSGWVYWGQALLTDGDQTPNFMESVTLVNQPEGSFYYVIHTELEAVSLDELTSGKVDWGDAGGVFAGKGGGDTGDPGDPGDGSDPGDGGSDEGKLPVKTGVNGFFPFKHSTDPSEGDGYYAKIFYPDRDNVTNNEHYQDGSIHLEDIITDGVYTGVTVTPADPVYAPFLRIADDKHGKPSIIFSYEPTNQEVLDWVLTEPGVDDSLIIPIKVALTRDDGKEATVTINMAYYECLFTLDIPEL